MNLFYPVDKKPTEYLGLLISISSIILVCGNLYKQASTKEVDLPPGRIWIEARNNTTQNKDGKDLFLTSAVVGTTSSASVVGIRVA